jgi:hypothetical protein
VKSAQFALPSLFLHCGLKRRREDSRARLVASEISLLMNVFFREKFLLVRGMGLKAR